MSMRGAPLAVRAEQVGRTRVVVEGRPSLAEAWLARGDTLRCAARFLWARSDRGVRLDDLLSVGVLGLAEAVDRYDPARGVPFVTYADARIRGAMLAAIRSDARHARAQEERIPAPDHPASDAAGRLYERDLRVALRRAVGELRPSARIVIGLCFQRGLTPTEAAAALGVDERLVAQTLHRALITLRRRLACSGFDTLR
jgi:RNA polymerase sigma factor (sigma-70 family)